MPCTRLPVASTGSAPVMPPPRAPLKDRVHAVLVAAEDKDRPSQAFDVFLMVLIVANVVAVVLETVESIWIAHRELFRLFDLISVAIFTVEYLLRLWTATADPRYRQAFRGRLRYAVTPMALVDLVAILPFYLPLAFPLDLRVVRILRLFRLLRLLKMARYSRSLMGLQEVVRSRREELLMAFSFAMALLLVAASVLYYAEHEAQPEQFASIPDAMWWGIATLTTVGYGDIYPVTSLGRICGGVVAIVGVGLFALPAGILASGLSEHMDKERRAKEADERAQAEADGRCPHCGKPMG
jgi:voltage-gated potassium channel